MEGENSKGRPLNAAYVYYILYAHYFFVTIIDHFQMQRLCILHTRGRIQPHSTKMKEHHSEYCYC